MRYWETPQKFLKYFPFPILVLTGAPCPFRPYAWANSYSKDYLCTLFMLSLRTCENASGAAVRISQTLQALSRKQSMRAQCILFVSLQQNLHGRGSRGRERILQISREGSSAFRPLTPTLCVLLTFFCKCKAYYQAWEQGQSCSLPSLMSK